RVRQTGAPPRSGRRAGARAPEPRAAGAAQPRLAAPVSAALIRPEGRGRRRAAPVRRLGGATRRRVEQSRRVERLFRARFGGAGGRTAAAVRPRPAAWPRGGDGVPAADRVPPSGGWPGG